MTIVVEFHGWRFRVDIEKTKAAYASNLFEGAEVCNCLCCQNLVAQREKEYPVELWDFLESVGVNPLKEAEVWSTGPLEAGYFFNTGWWHLIAEVEERGQTEFEINRNMDGNSRNWRLKVLPGESAIKFKGLPESPIVQIEYCADLPWVLSEAYPE